MAGNAANSPPLAALATASYGAILGSVFPVMTVMTIADVSGGLSVPIDSAALVNTMQNVGSVVGILAAPAFAAGIGRGRTMALAGGGFVLASVACACAPSLPWMLVARFAHGAFGGVLPLMFMLLVMTSLKPGSGRFEGMALFATSTSLFFGIAALLGGFLVDQLGWRSLFWVQAIAALPYTIAALSVLRTERGDPLAFRKADWADHALLSVGIGAILFALSEGERHFWSEAWWVPGLILGGAICVSFAVAGMARAARPLLMLSVFRRPTFSLAIVLSLVFRSRLALRDLHRAAVSRAAPEPAAGGVRETADGHAALDGARARRGVSRR
ncbi:MFS transporter [Sphingomonas sp. H160509]|uniref:MFS transporter n=1 Tax=Sphingomonas sp. H160509 TaxID=2955313 RepID=UPI0020971760|nr:MFS transporter [Sphingomonas sp. H160509]MDD1453275.1 MFS transporter [Sphingomonas sp. H160509]